MLIYEDNDVMREGLAAMIEYAAGYELAGMFADCRDVVNQVQIYQPDVILMDIEMPQVNGLEGIRRIRSVNGQVKIIVLTVFDDNDNVFNAVCAGANGYLLKKSSPQQIFQSVEDVLQGGAPMSASIANKVLKLLAGTKAATTDNDYNLTSREKEILQSLVRANSYKMIAAELGITYDTVKTHIKKVYEKLQVHSQAEAVAKAINQRIV